MDDTVRDIFATVRQQSDDVSDWAGHKAPVQPKRHVPWKESFANRAFYQPAVPRN